jgi:uncharacterized protein DUF4386
MLRISDARNFGRTLTGLLLIAAPVLILLGGIVQPDADSSNKVTELSKIAAHKGAYLTGALLFFLGGVLLIGGAIGLIHMFRGRRVTLGQVAGALLALGGTAMVGFYAFTSVEYEAATQAGLDRAQMALLVDKAQNAASGAPILVLFALGVVIGFIVLGVAAWRTRVVPRWMAALTVIAGPVVFASNGKAGGIVSSAVVLVVLGSLGLAALRMSDEEWGSTTLESTATDVPRTPVAEATA